MGRVTLDYGKWWLKICWFSATFKEGVAWDETKQHGGYRLGRDEREVCGIDSPMYFKWGDVTYHELDDSEGGLRQIGSQYISKTLMDKLFAKQRL